MRFRIHTALLLILVVAAVTASAQTWNSNAGGYNTGYGTVYGSFGLAMATQNIYNTTQMNLQRLTMRQAMIKKWGKAAVEKAEREARSGTSTRSSSTSSNTAGPVVTAPPPAPKFYGRFRADATVDTAKTIADSLGETPEEKAMLKQIVDGTKAAFEAETASRGWKNNIAGAMAFFLISNTTIYHEAAEPDDATANALFESINQAIDEVPDFGTASNKDKQAMYNLLIGFAGIPLATYTEGKNNNDAETVSAARQLAGKMIEIVLKTDPAKVRFDQGSLSIEKQ